LNIKLKVALIWIAPFLLGPIYAIARILLHRVYPHLVGTPTIREVFSVILLELVSSPLWIAVGYAFTWALGGVAVVYVVRALAHNKFLKRKFVISTKDGRDLDFLLRKESDEEPSKRTFEAWLTGRNFSLCLALTLSINLFYTIALQRYFSDIVTLPSGVTTGALYRYLLSPKLIVSDFLLALLFIPLIAIVIPLFLGVISIRQIDSSRFDIFWLTLIYSAVGGASLVLFLVTEFESKQATSYFIIAIILVYAILSWYAALGINLALPAAEQMLAKQLLSLKREEVSGSTFPSQKTPTNIIFGHIYAGKTKEDAEQV
jgi:hypothetical protein